MFWLLQISIIKSRKYPCLISDIQDLRSRNSRTMPKSVFLKVFLKWHSTIKKNHYLAILDMLITNASLGVLDFNPP